VDWVAWYFPGGPVGSASGWAATSNVEVGKAKDKVTERRIGKDGVEWGRGLGCP